jgi:uncharacterized membrane protein YphA (DoxX/SURF4 family)
MQRLAHPALVRLCQVVIGLLFAWAALAKIGDAQGFAAQVHNFRLLPVALENIVAVTLPWIELVAAMALVLNIRARSGAMLVFAMLAVFTVAIVAALVRGLDFECGCFGTADASRVGLVKVLENVAMLAVAGVSSLRPR